MDEINFDNGLATIKAGQSVDIQALRNSKVYARLMYKKGHSFNTKFNKVDMQLSEKGNHYRATCFIQNAQGAIIEVDKLFINVETDATIKTLNLPGYKMHFVELVHPVVDLSQATIVEA